MLSDTETAPSVLQPAAAAVAADVAADAETSADTSEGSKAIVKRPHTVASPLPPTPQEVQRLQEESVTERPKSCGDEEKEKKVGNEGGGAESEMSDMSTI